MTLFVEHNFPVTINTVGRNVFDVVGAGDTAVASVAVALAAGIPIEHAITFANIAAGIAVEKHGTAAVEVDELAAHPDALDLMKVASAAHTSLMATD